MVLRGLLGLSAVLVAGCSIVYDPDNLPPPTDAPQPDAPPTDADPSLFDITSVEPVEIDEGVGSDNGRPALFILHGTSIVLADLQVTVGFVEDTSGDAGVPDGGLPMPMRVELAVADNATQAGVAVRLPVLPELAAGQDAILRFTVVQNGLTRMQDVTVHGRDELTLTAASQLPSPAPLYSRITVPAGANLHFAGADVIRLHATAGITIDGVLDGDGVDATAGPHGCSGGIIEGRGNCSPGGGHPGINGELLALGNGGGGGGGGFAALATGGSGEGGGLPGEETGNVMLVPIETGDGQAGNRGNGGGGGGGALLGTAGLGGGGGGVLYIKAGGDITVGASGAVRARGGNGGAGTGNGGGGGGGSGGALLIRSGADISSSTRWLSAPGGTGGTRGGAGAAGRIRVDSAGGDVMAMANNPSAVQGPTWSATVPSTTSTSPFTARLRGQSGRAFEIRLNDAPAGTATPGAMNEINVTGLNLVPGKNVLCAVAVAGNLSADSMSCLDVFYIRN